MRLSKRGLRSTTARRRGAFRPDSQILEQRTLLAGNSIDLAQIATHPYGVELDGFSPGNAVGSRVAYVGNANSNSAGFEDYLVSGPNGTSTPGQAYLVFGSQSATAGNIDWRSLTSTQRIGQLNNLGNPGQPNGFNYNGVTFSILNANTSVANPKDAFVAGVGDVNADGIADFMIGFPNADNGAGRAYLVYGGGELSNLAASHVVVNLDTPPANLSVIAFQYSNPSAFIGAHAGTAMASFGNVFGDGSNAIGIGAPDVSYSAQQGGAVYLVPASLIGTKQSGTIFLDQIGQAGAAGILFTGANPGDRAGRSLAGVGNVDGSRGSRGLLGDFVIGAPGFRENSGALSGPGFAYLLYGAANLASQATVINGVNQIPLSTVGQTGGVTGAQFVGNTDATGFAVNSAGDFNNDGLGDILIGSPAANNFAGTVTMIYGRSATGSPGRITGTIPLGSIPSTVGSVQFQGSGINAEAGWSVAPVGKMISAAQPNEILIGSPGFLGDAGIVYLIPGQAGLLGSQNLSTAQSDPLDATVISNSTTEPTGAPSQNRFGESVSGRLTGVGQAATLDADTVGDFIIGAPGFSPTTATAGSIINAGSSFAVEGTFVPLSIPPSTQITTQIGVEKPFGPFTVNAQTPATMQIFVFSNPNTKPVAFHPVTDIDPTTVVVDGVAFPNATITADPVDENGDGIKDAIITIQPRSNLNLANGTQNFTISGRTLPTSPLANQTWSGTTQIFVTNGGGGGGTGGGPTSPVANQFFNLFFPGGNSFVPPIGSRLVPTIASLSRMRWKPLPFKVAYQQFDPTQPFAFRFNNFFHPIKTHPLGSRHGDKAGRTSTLGRHVFTRDIFHSGKPFRFTHSVPVIPPQQQTVGSVQHGFRNTIG